MWALYQLRHWGPFHSQACSGAPLHFWALCTFDRCHFLAHDCSLFKSSFILWQSSSEFILWYSLASSANSFIGHKVSVGMPFMKMVNSTSPNTLPWGIPLRTSDQLEGELFTRTLWRLFNRSFRASYRHFRQYCSFSISRIIFDEVRNQTLSESPDIRCQCRYHYQGLQASSFHSFQQLCYSRATRQESMLVFTP